MKELKVTIYTKDNEGKTRIQNVQWKDGQDEEVLNKMYDSIITIVREGSMELTEIEDKLKELRR